MLVNWIVPAPVATWRSQSNKVTFRTLMSPNVEAILDDFSSLTVPIVSTLTLSTKIAPAFDVATNPPSSKLTFDNEIGDLSVETSRLRSVIALGDAGVLMLTDVLLRTVSVLGRSCGSSMSIAIRFAADTSRQ